MLAPAGNIEQPNENAVRTAANGIVEIACDTAADKYSRDVSTFDGGKDSRNGFAMTCRRGIG